jgi:high-affinity iron transporter
MLYRLQARNRLTETPRGNSTAVKSASGRDRSRGSLRGKLFEAQTSPPAGVADSPPPGRMGKGQWLRTAAIIVAAVVVAAVFIWQGIAAGGNPDPTVPHTSFPVAALDIAVLVNREGLETVLVLAVLITGLKGSNSAYQRPIQVGAGLALIATVGTWFVALTIVGDLTVSYGALAVQAATGLFAIGVLLVVMNWFFHSVYWSGWINMHTRARRSLIAEAGQLGKNSRRVLLGLALLGFASVYREGFEVVLFLQSYYLQMGPAVVYYGAAAGLVLTLAAGYLTFLGHRRLPYKRMLILTGILLTGVLFVMVGEEVNEMQLAGWIGTTNIPWLQGIPDWAGLWFSIFPNVETFVGQAIVLLLVAGTYFFARYRMWKKVNPPASVVLSRQKKDGGEDTTTAPGVKPPTSA